MKFTVVWRPLAEARLAEIWVSHADDRQAITRASYTIDQLLRRDAPTRGESHSGSNRVLVVPPLAVSFDVQEDDRMVHFLSVRCIPPRVGEN